MTTEIKKRSDIEQSSSSHFNSSSLQAVSSALVISAVALGIIAALGTYGLYGDPVNTPLFIQRTIAWLGPDGCFSLMIGGVTTSSMTGFLGIVFFTISYRPLRTGLFSQEPYSPPQTPQKFSIPHLNQIQREEKPKQVSQHNPTDEAWDKAPIGRSLIREKTEDKKENNHPVKQDRIVVSSAVAQPTSHVSPTSTSSEKPPSVSTSRRKNEYSLVGAAKQAAKPEVKSPKLIDPPLSKQAAGSSTPLDKKLIPPPIIKSGSPSLAPTVTPLRSNKGNEASKPALSPSPPKQGASPFEKYSLPSAQPQRKLPLTLHRPKTPPTQNSFKDKNTGGIIPINRIDLKSGQFPTFKVPIDSPGHHPWIFVVKVPHALSPKRRENEVSPRLKISDKDDLEVNKQEDLELFLQLSILALKTDISASDVNQRCKNGMTPLMVAAWLGRFEDAKYLLGDVRTDPYLLLDETNSTSTAKNLAELCGHDRIIELLDERIANDIPYLLTLPNWDPNTVDLSGKTPLMIAAHYGVELSVYLLLMDKRVNPYKKTPHYKKTSHYKKRPPYKKTPLGQTAKDFAVRGNQQLIIHMLDARMLDDIHMLLDQDWDPNQVDCVGMTPLKIAVKWRHAKALLLLLADERVNREGVEAPYTHDFPFVSTEDEIKAFCGNSSIVELLKLDASHFKDLRAKKLLEELQVSLQDKTFDPNEFDIFGKTLLMRAAEQGDRARVELLLSDERVNPYRPAQFGLEHTARERADLFSKTEVADLLNKRASDDLQRAQNSPL